MEPTKETPFDELARQLKLSSEQVKKATELLDAGHSVPFLALFRLDETQGLGEGSLARLAERIDEYRQLERRKAGLLDYLRHRDVLDSQIENEVVSAESREQVDQLYAIYKRSRPPKGAIERIEPVSDVAQRVIENTIDLAELDTEYARLVAEGNALASLEEVRAAVREQVVQYIAHSVPLRVQALRVMRESGSFECQRFHEPHDADHEPESEADELAAPSAEPSAPADPSAMATLPADPDQPVSPDPRVVDDTAASPATHVGAQIAEATAANPVVPDVSFEHAEEARLPNNDGSGVPTSSANASIRPAGLDQSAAVTSAPRMKSLSAKKSPLSLTEERRHKRKQARMRRRAHLEAALKDYFNKSFPIHKLTIHQFADIDYGERVRVLSARIKFDEHRLEEAATALLVSEDSYHGVLLQSAWAEAKTRFILADCERIIRREFSERMEQHVIQAVKRHVRSMCMQRPLRAPLLAVSAHRDGFSLVAVDSGGRILASRDLSRNEYGPDRIKQEIKDLVQQLGLAYVAIEAAERTRLIQQMLADSLGDELKDLNVAWLTIADEGLVNYCRSATGCEEIPGVTPEQRAAIAVARRAQSPLTEFVKVEPRDWLSEQQQATVNVQRLRDEIEGVYRSCLARVGMDVNLVEPSILRKLPGVDEAMARRIEAHRIAHGHFRQISELCQALDLGGQASELVGFLRISQGSEPLDAIGVHPDHYPLAERLLSECGMTKVQLAAEVAAGRPPVAAKAHEQKPETAVPLAEPEEQHEGTPPVSREVWDRSFRVLEFQKLGELLGITREHARRLVNELRFAGRDVRDNSRWPVVRYGSLRSENFQPGELLAGRVVNTTSFGAFVEVAPGTVGLIHVSRLGDGFVRDPREVLMEGERIPVWILTVDRERNRIALSLSPPGAQRPASADQAASRKRSAAPLGAAAISPTRKSRSASGTGRGPQHAAKPRKPKHVVPITEEMKSGREPMRTFGDLKQFFDIKATPRGKSPNKKSDGGEQGKNNKS